MTKVFSHTADPTEVVPKPTKLQSGEENEQMGSKHFPGKVGFDPAVQEHKV